MAEAFLNFYGKGRFVADSAGIEPGRLNPFVVSVMREKGIDISGNATKSVASVLHNGYDVVVTVCDETSAERCPVFPGKVERLHWGFPDPSSAKGTEEEKLGFARAVRDEIEKNIKEFVER